MQQELVLVVDFGGQYSQLIARRVRELGVYSEMIPFDTPLEEIRQRAPRGLIFSGGPASIYLPGAPVCDPGVFELGLPLLGICYGMQLMAAQLGGKVEPAGIREYGKTALAVSDAADPLFAGLESQQQVWMSHGDSITRVPQGFHVTASTADCPIAAMAAPDKRFYGVQFHPEVRHTPNGNAMLRNFLYRVCECQGTWRLADFVEETVREIRERVGDRHVICALSGGVDSSVAAVLVNRAVGDRLTCVFVDTGLLRKGEAEQVVRVFRDERKMNLVFVYARQRFLERLAGVTDPERKRIIIGHEFIRVFEEEAARIGRVDFLVQGTLYPDVVESGTRTSATIKTHHNVGGLPTDMKFELIEPLRLLFKDEVRQIGEQLGLPRSIVWRQPFPGPGLGVRVLEEVTAEKVEIVREADAIVTEEIERAGLDREIWQYFAVLPPVRSVGVMGDERTYAYPIIVRAVVSEDAMTADWARLPYQVLDTISRRIVNEVRHVNRVVYDITSKPPGTIEWE